MQYPLWVVGVFTTVFACTYALIFTEKIDKTLAALLGAVVTASLGEVLGIFSYETLAGFLEFETIAILIGMFILTGAAESVGIFQFLAIKVTKASRGEPSRLLLSLSILTVLLSSIISKIVAIMIMGSLTMRIAKDLDLDPKPYIIARARKQRLTVQPKEEKIKRKKDCERRIRSQLVSLISISISSWGSSPCIAFSAVYRSASVRFERNFTFLATLSTNCLMHFSWFSPSIRHLDYTSDSLKELVSSEH